MPGSKEIRTKIKSVQNTRKITKAMEMVAASKMRKAQDRMRAGRPYGEKIRAICSNLSHANPEYRHPFLTPHGALKRVGLVVVTTDKGLCGGLNTNLLRMVLMKMREWSDQKIESQMVAIGNKGLGFFSRAGAKIVSHVTHLGDTPHLEQLIGPLKVQLDAFTKGEVDAVYLCYNKFINTMKQEPLMLQLLPLTDDRLERTDPGHDWDYVYEPDAATVLDDLLLRYVESVIYQAVAENMSCEQSARMVAMKAASDNAKKVIDDLQLTYNKARQAGITKELSEIVGGAAAV
ncbi:MAG: F0F1 ATP synthase subunit gamma [Burkholderiaceae bacterium]|nr:F0F1 ATP synthase subunit gamma [Burkholderiaceae bacterium]